MYSKHAKCPWQNNDVKSGGGFFFLVPSFSLQDVEFWQQDCWLYDREQIKWFDPDRWGVGSTRKKFRSETFWRPETPHLVAFTHLLARPIGAVANYSLFFQTICSQDARTEFLDQVPFHISRAKS